MSEEPELDVDLEEGKTVRGTLLEEGDPDEQRNTRDLEMNVFEGVRDSAGNPVTPVRLKREDGFCFSCHKDVACWNRCCHGADITLTPGDILRLSRRLMLSPADFLTKYTVPAMWNKADLPVAKLKMGGDDGRGACAFVRDSGCAVYKDRPETCRLYPLGMASAKMKSDADKQDFYFLVKESHCQGHAESKEQSVEGYLGEQGADRFAAVDRGWIDILMKMVSWKVVGGPGGKDLPAPTKRMFFMVSTDVQAFRRFVFETRFLETYEIDAASVEVLRTDDEALLMLGFDWMRNVMFNEPTISMKEAVLHEATAKAREQMGAM